VRSFFIRGTIRVVAKRSISKSSMEEFTKCLPALSQFRRQVFVKAAAPVATAAFCRKQKAARKAKDDQTARRSHFLAGGLASKVSLGTWLLQTSLLTMHPPQVAAANTPDDTPHFGASEDVG